MNDLSVGLSVGPFVGLSVGRSFHCGKPADRMWMLFGIMHQMGPGMRQVVGFGDRSMGRGTFGGEFGACHCNQWGVYSIRVQYCLNRRRWFGVVHAVGQWGSTSSKGKGMFQGFCSQFSQWQMPLGRRRWNVSNSCAKTWQHFRTANVSLESSIHGLFGDIFSFKTKVGVYEKLAKGNDCSKKPLAYAAKLLA